MERHKNELLADMGEVKERYFQERYQAGDMSREQVMFYALMLGSAMGKKNEMDRLSGQLELVLCVMGADEEKGSKMLQSHMERMEKGIRFANKMPKHFYNLVTGRDFDDDLLKDTETFEALFPELKEVTDRTKEIIGVKQG